MTAERTLGIDLSAQPKNTAACLIAWGEEGAEIETLICGSDKSTPLEDDDLLELMDTARMSGIDSPFGWPVEFVEAIRGWEASSETGGKWPDTVDFNRYRLRLTDREITEPRPPLSVSTNYIGVTAMRCARLLVALGDQVDRSGATGSVIEVYPAAALYRWGLPADGYKRAKGKEVRADLVERLCHRLASFCPLDPEQRALCERDDNALDALIASLVVRARLKDATTEPKPEQLRKARIEGWIHRPTCELEELA